MVVYIPRSARHLVQLVFGVAIFVWVYREAPRHRIDVGVAMTDAITGTKH